MVLIPGILVGYLMLCAALYFNQERMLFFPTTLPQDFVYPADHPYTEVFLPIDGVTLALAHFRRPDPQGVVLYLHGNGTTLESAGSLSQRFIDRGYDVVIVDYRGYGKSTGRITSEADLHTDARAAYDYVLEHYREEQIVLYGQSLGSGLAVRLAAELSPRLLLLESPYFSMRDLVGQKYPFVPPFLLKYQLRSDLAIGAVACPIYFFHGTDDTLIPFDASERLLEIATAPARLIRIAGGGHSDLYAFALYQAELDEILGDGLAAALP